MRTEQWREANPARTSAAIKRWRIANPEQIRRLNQGRKARKRALPATLTTEQWEAIKAAYKGCCAYCGKKSERLQQDHVIPLSKSGEYTAQNIAPSCGPCNFKKRTGPPPKPVQTLLL